MVASVVRISEKQDFDRNLSRIKVPKLDKLNVIHIDSSECGDDNLL